jgi:hypothetical protein
MADYEYPMNILSIKKMKSNSNNKKLTFELPISCGMGYLFHSNLKSGYPPTKIHLDGQILFQMILKI